jgi:hypothetical protein
MIDALRRRILSAYISAATYSEILAAWLITVQAHPDHIGHPLF